MRKYVYNVYFLSELGGTPKTTSIKGVALICVGDVYYILSDRPTTVNPTVLGPITVGTIPVSNVLRITRQDDLSES